MEFLDTKTGDVVVVPTEEKPQRVARVNPNVLCGDCEIPAEQLTGSLLPPTDRIILPRDVAEFNDDDDIVWVIGTKDGKVTKIDGFENMKNLKVLSS